MTPAVAKAWLELLLLLLLLRALELATVSLNTSISTRQSLRLRMLVRDFLQPSDLLQGKTLTS
jgi:hypothetical protein